ncbi:MAG: N-acetylmuramoyl-L-alanine amidase [Myxococcota bacterium]
MGSRGEAVVVGSDRRPEKARRARWIAAAGAGLSILAADAPRAERSSPDRFDLVVIDAGHGGEDTGAHGAGGLSEKELVLDVSERIASRLRRRGLQVVLTRESDVFVPLEQRTSAANDARGDLFLSIHANASKRRGARGIETYFVSLEATDDAAEQVARRENEAFPSRRGSASMNDPFLALLGDMIATQHVMESNEFAKLAQRELAEIDSAPSRGVKQAPFIVLMGVQMPASLVEIGFLTNAEDERALKSSARRDALADALARAVIAFGRRFDARRGVSAQVGGAGEGG